MTGQVGHTRDAAPSGTAHATATASGTAHATAASPAATTSTATTTTLDIGGMTCASCAVRIEKKLGKVDGVTATVNYATERASIEAPAGTDERTLIEAVEQAGYTATVPPADEVPPGDELPDPALLALRRRLIVSGALAIPVVALAMIAALQFPGWQLVSLLLAAPVVLWAGWPFHRAAAVNLRHGAATMDTLISIGTLAAFAWSLVAIATGTGHVYLEVAAAVTTFVLAGRFFERRSKRQAGAAIRALASIGAKDVAVLRNGRETRIPVSHLTTDDTFVVRPGEKIATDGVVVDGASAVDAALVTGESVPVEVTVGDTVTGGTVNASGRLVVRATRVGADTQLARMAALVEQAQSGKAQVQRLADRVSGVFVPVVIAVAAVTLVGWLVTGHPASSAFTAAVAVLIVACPCALGLATPTALLVGTGRGAQLGILVKGPEALESTRRVDTVLLDKTGTVTSGRMSVVSVLLAGAAGGGEAAAADVLRLAAAVESASEHPIGRAISAAGLSPADDLPAVTAFANRGGLGVHGIVDGDLVVVGRRELLAEWGAAPDPALEAAAGAAEAGGRTVVFVHASGSVIGAVVVADTVKPSSREAVESLRALGLTPLLLTGDNPAVARLVADEVGIETVFAGVLPTGKASVVARLQAEGHVVAMVGDGVNDAAALARADLGIAMGAGSDVAIEASDLTIVGDDLRAAADAVRLSRRTIGTIRANLFWAFAYNVAAIPLAAFGLLDPMIAGAAMAFSSVFVVGNSLRLRRFRR